MTRFSAERARRTGYAVLVTCAYFGFPIAALAPVVLGMPSRSISVAYRALVAAASLVYATAVLPTRRAAIATPVQWALGLLTIMLLARLAWDSFIVQLPLDLPWEIMWAQLLVFVLIPAVPFLVEPEREAVALARSMCLWVGVLAVFAAVVGALYSVKQFSLGNRLSTDVVNPITVGEIGVSLFIVALSYLPTAPARRFHWVRIGGRLVAGALGIVVCMLSASKGPLLSLAAVVLAMFGYRLVRLTPRRQAVELVAALLFVGVLAALAVFLNKAGVLTVYGRVSEVTSDASTALRLQAWDGALTQFNSSPLWGNAVVELSTRFYPHNAILEIMMATGVGGLLLLVLLQLFGAVAAHNVLIRAPEYSWVALLFLQHAISAMLSGSVYLGGANWISLLMLLGIYQFLAARDAAGIPGLGAGQQA